MCIRDRYTIKSRIKNKRAYTRDNKNSFIISFRIPEEFGPATTAMADFFDVSHGHALREICLPYLRAVNKTFREGAPFEPHREELMKWFEELEDHFTNQGKLDIE